MSKIIINNGLSTLDRIIEAARSLLSQHGFEQLTMRAVAAEAGVTPGAIYKHFGGKAELVDHVVHTTFAGLHHRLTAVIAAHAPGSFQRVVALGQAYIDMAQEKPEHFKVLFTHHKPEPTKMRDLPGEGGFTILRQCIAEAVEAGTMRRVDPDLAAFYLWSRVHGIVMLMMSCDFSENLPVPPDQVTSGGMFHLTREMLWFGLEPEHKTPTPREPEDKGPTPRKPSWSGPR